MPRRSKPVIPLTDSQRELATSALPLVEYVVGEYARKLPDQVSPDDLMQDGMIGAMSAARKFDPARGVKFTSFASRYIRGAIVDGLRGMDWVPRQVRRRKEPITELISINAITRRATGNNSSESTIADELGCDAIGLSDVDRIDCVRALFRGLGRRDRLMMDLLYIDGLTMKEAGRAIGVSESRVSQLHADVIVRLRGKVAIFPTSRKWSLPS